MELRASACQITRLLGPAMGAACLGSLLGFWCFVFAMFAMTPLGWPDNVSLSFGFLFYFVFMFPKAAICLLVIGVPAALALRDFAEKRWMAPVAVVAGGVAGQFLAYAIGFHRFGAGPRQS